MRYGSVVDLFALSFFSVLCHMSFVLSFSLYCLVLLSACSFSAVHSLFFVTILCSCTYFISFISLVPDRSWHVGWGGGQVRQAENSAFLSPTLPTTSLSKSGLAPRYSWLASPSLFLVGWGGFGAVALNHRVAAYTINGQLKMG